MQNIQNHKISLWLNGQFPKMHRTPDILLFVDSMQTICPSEFSNKKIQAFFGLFQNNNSFEFYFTCLNKFQRMGLKKYMELMIKLNVPEELINEKDLSFYY